MIAVLIVFHAANQKKRMKKILKQDSNSIQRQDIIPVSNLKASKIKTLLLLPIHLYHHPISDAAIARLSLRCRSAIAAVAPAVATLSLLISLLLLLRCCSTVTPLSLHCQSAIAQLLLHCRCCCYTATPAIAPAVTPAVALMLLRCRSAIIPLSVQCRSVVAPLSLLSLLMLLLLSLLLSLLISLHCCCLDCSCSSPQEAESG